MYSTYYLEKGDEVPCTRCENKLILEYEPAKCCMSEQDSYYNQCSCQGAPESVFCEGCWMELEKSDIEQALDDLKNGNVNTFESVEDLINEL